MPTSGVTAWSLTAAQIITAAMQEIGLLDSGESPTAQEQTDCMVRLNALLKSWSVRGNLFREETGEIDVPEGSPSGTLTQSIRDINAVRLVVSATNERPLTQWNRGQYYAFPNRAATGSPTAYYVEKKIGGVELYLWPVPNEDVTLKIDYSRAADTVTAGSETVDIPQEWQEAVIKGLAVRIANMFGAARVDPVTLQKVANEAQALETQLLDADRPDSYIFEPYEWNYG